MSKIMSLSRLLIDVLNWSQKDVMVGFIWASVSDEKRRLWWRNCDVFMTRSCQLGYFY